MVQASSLQSSNGQAGCLPHFRPPCITYAEGYSPLQIALVVGISSGSVRKLLLEGKSVETVCKETGHSPEGVQRYIRAFKQVLLLRRKGLRDGEIAFGIRMSPRLVAEYQNLINEMSEDNPVLKNLLNMDGKEVR